MAQLLIFFDTEKGKILSINHAKQLETRLHNTQQFGKCFKEADSFGICFGSMQRFKNLASAVSSCYVRKKKLYTTLAESFSSRKCFSGYRRTYQRNLAKYTLLEGNLRKNGLALARKNYHVIDSPRFMRALVFKVIKK